MKRSLQSPSILLTGLSLLTALVLGACSDNTIAPDPAGGTPPGSTATIAISDPVNPDEAASVRNNASRNSSQQIVVDIDSAIAIALGRHGGDLLGVNLDYDRESLRYECVVRRGGRVYVIVIDPQTGSVVEEKQVSNAYYTTVIVIRTITVKIKEAKDRARQVANGDVVECNIEQIDGRPTYIIIVLDGSNRYVTVYIDCETGRERKLKNDGRCDNEDGDDDDDDRKKEKKRGRGHYRHGNGHGYGHHYHCHCDCPDDDDNGGGDSTNVRDSVISVDSAKAIATGLIDSSTATEANLHVVDDSTATYTVKLERDSNRFTVTLDAFTGGFMEIEQTAGDMDSSDYQPTVPNDTLVALSIARTAALAQVAGEIWSWKLRKDSVDDAWVYVFTILEPGATDTKKVVIDAKTGAFKRIDV